MSDPPIQFHESEYYDSPLEEDTLRILLSFLPREAYDKLLYEGKKWYNKEGLVRPDEKENPTLCPDFIGTTEEVVIMPDIVGTRFGRLTVLREFDPYRGQKRYVCVCDCGKEKIMRRCHLITSLTQSCGCLGREMTSIKNTKHGNARKKKQSPEYMIWASMIQRCNNPRIKYYDNYGGRGIEVCDRWKDFSCFIEDMGPRPSTGHSIDRIDVNGNYDPANCRWATVEEQSLNKRIYISNRSGYSGVTWLGRINKWQVNIRSQGKVKYLGVFTNLDDAINARKQAELEYRGRTS